MTDNEIKVMCLTAARWWADKVDGTKKHDNGDKEVTGLLAGIMADGLMEPVSKDNLEHFAQVLAEDLIGDYIVHHSSGIYLGCDYNPCNCLRIAAMKCSIPVYNFPWKTDMGIHFDEGVIVVSDGYGQPWETIWKREESKET